MSQSKLRKGRCRVIACFGAVLDYYKFNWLTRNVKPKGMHGRFANWEYIKLEKIGPVSPARYYPSIQSFFNATKGPIEQ